MQLTKTQGETGAGVNPASRAVIEARDLKKVYGRGENRVEALAGVSLDVNTG